MRIVIDTNIVVSYSISGRGAAAQIIRKWHQEQFEVLVSEPILAEYERALGYERVRIRHRMTNEKIHTLVNQFRRFAIMVEPSETLKVVVDDPDDNKFLECAAAGAGAYVVSSDPHLLTVKHYHGIQILSPITFLAFLKNLPT